MISFMIYDDTRLVYTDQWIIQKRTLTTKATSKRKAGEWTDWHNAGYYNDMAHALHRLTREALGRLDGDYHRDDIDVVVAALNGLQTKIDSASSEWRKK